MLIESLSGTRIDIERYGLRRLYHYIPSAEIVHNAVAVEGRGEIIVDSQLDNRTITVDVSYKVSNISEYYSLRDEVNSLLVRDGAFYIIFKNEPEKRWKVRLARGFDVEPDKRMKSFSLSFRTVNKYAENTGSPITRSFNTNNFNLAYEGNATVDPRESELEITIKADFTNLLTVTNKATGDVYTVRGPLTRTNTVKISGIKTTIDDVSNYSRTNGNLITIVPGNNQFEISGGTINSITFNYRNLYK